MNKQALVKVAEFLASQGITPTAEMVIGLSVRTLVESGIAPDAAYDAVMGEGSFQRLANQSWETLNTPVAA